MNDINEESFLKGMAEGMKESIDELRNLVVDFTMDEIDNYLSILGDSRSCRVTQKYYAFNNYLSILGDSPTQEKHLEDIISFMFIVPTGKFKEDVVAAMKNERAAWINILLEEKTKRGVCNENK